MCFILLRSFTWIFRNTGYFQANQAKLVVALHKTHLSTCHGSHNIITQTHQGTLQSASQKVLNGLAQNHTPLIIRHTRNTALAQPLNRSCQQLTVPFFLDLPNWVLKCLKRKYQRFALWQSTQRLSFTPQHCLLQIDLLLFSIFSFVNAIPTERE